MKLFKSIIVSVFCLLLTGSSMITTEASSKEVNSGEIEIDLSTSSVGDIFVIYEDLENDILIEVEIIDIEKKSTRDIGNSGWSGGSIPYHNVSMAVRANYIGHWFEYYVHSNNQSFYAVDRLTYFTTHNWTVQNTWLSYTKNKATLEFTAFRNRAGSVGISYDGLGMNLTGNSTASFRGYLIFEMNASGNVRTLWSL